MNIVIRRKLVDDPNLLNICWKELTSVIESPGNRLSLACLSSDIIKNVVAIVGKNSEEVSFIIC